jgi:hypothetical protein
VDTVNAMARYVVLRRHDARGLIRLKDFRTVEEAADFVREQGERERPGNWRGYWPDDSQIDGRPSERGAVGVWLVKAQRATVVRADTPLVSLSPSEDLLFHRRLFPEDGAA